MNNYPKHFFNSHRPSNVHTNLDKDACRRRVVLPYVNGCTERLSRILRKHDVGVYYRPFNKLRSIFGYQKDPIEPNQVRGVVYEVPCSDCDRTYIGQTGNSLHTRIKQHRAACRLFQRDKSALAEHSIDLDHRIDWDNAKVVSRQPRWHQRLFEEAFITTKTRDPLNRAELFLPPVYKKLM